MPGPVIALIAVLVLWMIGTLPCAADEDATLAARLDTLAAGFMVTEREPGAVAAVVSGDAVILRGHGFADLEAATAAGVDDVRFESGAITKLFTWIDVMMLVEQDRIDLDADVAH